MEFSFWTATSEFMATSCHKIATRDLGSQIADVGFCRWCSFRHVFIDFVSLFVNIQANCGDQTDVHMAQHVDDVESSSNGL